MGGSEGTAVSGDDALAQRVQAARAALCTAVAARSGLPLLAVRPDANVAEAASRVPLPTRRLP